MHQEKQSSDECNGAAYTRSYTQPNYLPSGTEIMTSPSDINTPFMNEQYYQDFYNFSTGDMRRNTSLPNCSVFSSLILPGFLSEFDKIDNRSESININSSCNFYGYPLPFQSNFLRDSTNFISPNSVAYYHDPNWNTPRFLPKTTTNFPCTKNDNMTSSNEFRRHSLPEAIVRKDKNSLKKVNHEERIIRRKIINRSAAFRSRQRKSAWVEDTRMKLQHWRTQNKILSDQVSILQEKLVQIHYILKFACANCNSILKYQNPLPVDSRTIDVDPKDIFMPWGISPTNYVPMRYNCGYSKEINLDSSKDSEPSTPDNNEEEKTA